MIGQGYGKMSRREIREMGIMCYQLGVKDAEDLQRTLRIGINGTLYMERAIGHLDMGELLNAKRVLENGLR